LSKIFNIFLIAVVAVVIIEAGFILKDKNAGAKSLSAYAGEMIQKCAKQSWKPGCYDKEIPKLMDRISMEDAFKVTKLIQQEDTDTNYFYCHVLGHNLSAKETAKDPSKWKEVITRCPSGMCSNGCIHGAFQERFRSESLPDSEIDKLLPELKTICEPKPKWNPTGMEKATCYHALGHLMMYITDADIKKSNSICDKAAPEYLRVCYDGNFMQIYQPLEPEDFALVKKFDMDTREKAAEFCGQFTGQQLGSCWRESWPLSREELRTPKGLVKFCNYFKDKTEKEICYNAEFYVLAAQFGFDIDKIKNLCSELPGDVKGQCFANSASRLIETDYGLISKSVDLCKTAAQFGVQAACYDELLKYSTFNFQPGSEGALKTCNSLIEPWKTKCLSKN